MIWLIGSKGMLGREIQRSLEENFIDFIASDIETDIYSLDNLRSFIKKRGNIKYIINCAAYTNVDGAEDDIKNAMNLNGYALKNLALLSVELNAILIHFSTDYVFDGFKKEAYIESDKPNPKTVYGKSKLSGENFIKDITDKYFIFRISWLYGKYGKNFVKTILNLLKSRDELKVVNDQSGSPTNARELSKNILEIIQKRNNNYGLYHYSGEGHCTWYDFSLEIERMGLKYNLLKNKTKIIPVSSEEFPTKALRPLNSLLLKDKFVKNTGMRPKHWRESLEDFFKMYKDNIDEKI